MISQMTSSYGLLTELRVTPGVPGDHLVGPLFVGAIGAPQWDQITHQIQTNTTMCL